MDIVLSMARCQMNKRKTSVKTSWILCASISAFFFERIQKKKKKKWVLFLGLGKRNTCCWD